MGIRGGLFDDIQEAEEYMEEQRIQSDVKDAVIEAQRKRKALLLQWLWQHHRPLDFGNALTI